MSARILDLNASRWSSKDRVQGGAALAAEAERLHFWRGASGHCYVHSVYSLVECPPLPAANFVLARKDTRGRTVNLTNGRVSHHAPTLNLAELRQLGAGLGASEVHIHLLAASEAESRLIALDIEAATQPAGNCNHVTGETTACSALAG